MPTYIYDGGITSSLIGYKWPKGTRVTTSSLFLMKDENDIIHNSFCIDIYTTINRTAQYSDSNECQKFLSIDQLNKIRYVLNNFYDLYPISYIAEKTGISTLTLEETIGAMQLKIWTLADSTVELYDANLLNVVALYNYMENNIGNGWTLKDVESVKDTITIDINKSKAECNFDGTNIKYGPFSIESDSILAKNSIYSFTINNNLSIVDESNNLLSEIQIGVPFYIFGKEKDIKNPIDLNICSDITYGYDIKELCTSDQASQQLITTYALKTKVCTEIELNPKILKIVKIDGCDKSVLKDVSFEIFDENYNYIDIITTNEEGIAYSKSCINEKYKLKEVKGPIGYIMNSDYIDISKGISQGIFTVLEIKNYKYKKLTVHKYDFDSKEPLANAIYELRTSLGQLIDNKETDESGMIIFDELVTGTYYLKEIKAPEGYSIKKETESITFENCDIVKELSISNSKEICKNKLVIIKHDSCNSNILLNAEFKIFDKNDEYIVTVNTVNGKAEVELESDFYYLLETKAPENYEKITEKIIIDFQDCETKILKIPNCKKKLDSCCYTDKKENKCHTKCASIYESLPKLIDCRNKIDACNKKENRCQNKKESINDSLQKLINCNKEKCRLN